MKDLPWFEDTINWDPYSDSLWFIGMNEANLENEEVYLQLELHESYCKIYIESISGKVPRGLMRRISMN